MSWEDKRGGIGIDKEVEDIRNSLQKIESKYLRKGIKAPQIHAGKNAAISILSDLFVGYYQRQDLEKFMDELDKTLRYVIDAKMTEMEEANGKA